MFTLDQIKNAHAKMKSGADFPAYVQELKSLGIRTYEHMVADGQIFYQGEAENKISGPAKWPPMPISTIGSKEKLQHALSIHQQGQTNYPTFCQQAAEAGVEKWVLDLDKMLCIYMDACNAELLVEKVPTV